MKKVLLVLTVVILSLGFYSIHLIDKSVKEILNQLEISEENAKDYIFSDVSGNYFSYPYSDKLKSLPQADRSLIVKVVGEYAKQYTKTQEFLDKYAEYRENRKPAPPEEPKYSEQLKKEQKENIEKSIKELETNKKNAPADQQSIFDERFKMFKQQLADIDNPDNPMYSKDMDAMIKQGYDMQITEYKNRVAEWEIEYPENNPKSMIVKWLENFLNETNDIAFGAELQTNQWGKKVFVNSDYESKSYLWKLCYRTGKDATETARAFAGEWLKELK